MISVYIIGIDLRCDPQQCVTTIGDEAYLVH
jgi:hypothetical protein